MSLRLYDTATRAVREFTPVEPGRVAIYLCGATVQGPPHIGHIRSGLDFDILRRWLTRSGCAVTLVRNVTDIDDKIIARAADEDVPFWVVATRNELAFNWAYDVLGCLPPSGAPRATGSVPEMITLMRRLIDGGHAYAADGDVYFDVRSWPDYGALSGQRLDHMQAAADSIGAPGKRDPRDFALWKAARAGEPSWDTPWGAGRPGWHLECSAMISRYLGPVFDIHGGGLDLVFPHHENELAQSRAAGDEFARFWLHNAWVTTGGEKMSKSLGNSLLVSELVQRVRPVDLRYYLGSAHYRSHLEYSWDALQDAAAAYARLEGFVRRAEERVGPGAPDGPLPAAFVDAMDDDLGVPQALAVLHDAVRLGNKLLSSGADGDVGAVLAEVRAMLDVLGLDPDAYGVPGAGDPVRRTVATLLDAALAEREQARARRDWAAADAVRDRLAAAGVAIEDSPRGPRWSIEAEA